MKNLTNSTAKLPGFYKPLRRRKRRSAQQIFADKIASLKRKSFKQIGEIFGRFIPEKHLKPEESGSMSRCSIFSKENTFWAFLGQVIDADGGCKEVVRKLQSYASLKGARIPSSSTASYCTARKKLDEQTLTDIFLGDKGSCSYYDIVKLKEQGVDSVIMLARRKPVSKSKCLKLHYHLLYIVYGVHHLPARKVECQLVEGQVVAVARH